MPGDILAEHRRLHRVTKMPTIGFRTDGASGSSRAGMLALTVFLDNPFRREYSPAIMHSTLQGKHLRKRTGLRRRMAG